jgi:uncharacterized membrane protein
MRVTGRAGGLATLVVLVLTATTGAALHQGPVGQTGIDADTVVLEADVDADGDAAWRVSYRIRLDDQNTTDAFEDLRADIEANTAQYLDRFEGRIRRTVTDAENATGREMAVRNVTVDVTREPQPDVEFGTITYRYEWTGFATSDGDTVRAGDAVDRLILDSGTVLQFTWPAEYGLQSSTPEPTTTENDRVVWRGPQDFDAGEPRISLTTGATATEPGGGSDGSSGGDGRSEGESDGGDGGDGSGAGGSLGLVALAALVVVFLAGGWVLVRRSADDDGAEIAGSDGPGEDSDGDETGDGSSGPPPELLSNEERVLQLLEDNGGRMKQKAVAEQLDWTAAKTSQVVGDLRDAGDVESFRLGRENVLTLPDVAIGPDAGDEDEGAAGHDG